MITLKISNVKNHDRVLHYIVGNIEQTETFIPSFLIDNAMTIEFKERRSVICTSGFSWYVDHTRIFHSFLTEA